MLETSSRFLNLKHNRMGAGCPFLSRISVTRPRHHQSSLWPSRAVSIRSALGWPTTSDGLCQVFAISAMCGAPGCVISQAQRMAGSTGRTAAERGGGQWPVWAGSDPGGDAGPCIWPNSNPSSDEHQEQGHWPSPTCLTRQGGRPEGRCGRSGN